MPRKNPPEAAVIDIDKLLPPPPPSPIVQTLRKDWRWAGISQFLFTFSDAFGLVDWDIDALEADFDGDESAIIPDVLVKHLFALTYDKRISRANVFESLRKQYIKRRPRRNPLGSEDAPIEWAQLGLGNKVGILWQLCEWQMEDPAKFRGLLKSEEEAGSWRIDPVGWDKDGNTYFLFDDNRLWIQRARPRLPSPEPEIKIKDEKKTSSVKSKKGRKGRASESRSHKKRPRPETNGDDLDDLTPPPAEPVQEAPVSGPRSRKQVSFYGNPTSTVQALKRGGPSQTWTPGSGSRPTRSSRSSGTIQLQELPTPTRPSRSKAATESSPQITPLPRGTRVSRRLRDVEDEWQQVPPEWLEATTKSKAAKGKGKAKAKAGADGEESDLSDLTDEEEHAAMLSKAGIAVEEQAEVGRGKRRRTTRGAVKGKREEEAVIPEADAARNAVPEADEPVEEAGTLDDTAKAQDAVEGQMSEASNDDSTPAQALSDAAPLANDAAGIDNAPHASPAAGPKSPSTGLTSPLADDAAVLPAAEAVAMDTDSVLGADGAAAAVQASLPPSPAAETAHPPTDGITTRQDPAEAAADGNTNPAPSGNATMNPPKELSPVAKAETEVQAESGIDVQPNAAGEGVDITPTQLANGDMIHPNDKGEVADAAKVETEVKREVPQEPEEEFDENDEVQVAARDDANPPEGLVEWEAVCVTLYDWRTFPEQFAKSRDPDEKNLYTFLTAEAGPQVIEALVAKEQERLKQAAINNRKRSSRIATKELEKEEIERCAAAQAEMEARMEKMRQEEKRAKREAAEAKAKDEARESRLREREERLSARERAIIEKEEEEIREKERKDKARERRQRKRDGEVVSGSEGEEEDGAKADTPIVHPASDKPKSTPKRKKPRKNSKANGKSEEEGWELRCEVCRKAGVNLDDDADVVCCDSCNRWQHVECHDRRDAQEGRPQRDWDNVDFKCKECRHKAARQRERAEQMQRQGMARASAVLNGHAALPDAPGFGHNLPTPERPIVGPHVSPSMLGMQHPQNSSQQAQNGQGRTVYQQNGGQHYSQGSLYDADRRMSYGQQMSPNVQHAQYRPASASPHTASTQVQYPHQSPHSSSPRPPTPSSGLPHPHAAHANGTYPVQPAYNHARLPRPPQSPLATSRQPPSQAAVTHPDLGYLQQGPPHYVQQQPHSAQGSQYAQQYAQQYPGYSQNASAGHYQHPAQIGHYPQLPCPGPPGPPDPPQMQHPNPQAHYQQYPQYLHGSASHAAPPERPPQPLPQAQEYQFKQYTGPPPQR